MSEKSGKKFIGYACTYVPVEIITAAGFVPHRLTGNTQSTNQVYSYLPPTACSFVRSSLENALRGDLGFLDGVIIPLTCDALRETFDVWQDCTDFSFYHRLVVPLRHNTEDAEIFFVEELKKLAQVLSDASGQAVTDDGLIQAINVHNRRRQLLQELGKKRAELKITGRNFIEIYLKTSQMPPQDALEALERALEELPEKNDSNKTTRLMLVGSCTDNMEIISLFERNGSAIVSDNLCYGSRAYDFKVQSTGSPLTDIAKGYLHKNNCACRYPGISRWDKILVDAEENKVDGIVLLMQKFCDTHHFERPDLERWLNDAGYPVLGLEIENQTAAETLTTRVEAFLEMIFDPKETKGRRKIYGS